MPELLPADLVVTHAAELCTMEGPPGGGVAAAGIVADGALAARDGTIVWVGPSAELSAHVAALPGAETLDASGQVVTPGLVDPHTHLVFAGDRASEFAQRCGGAGYLEIARAGGGIQSTVAATRAATDAELLELAAARASLLLRQGVTTCEVKSGYGLDVASELRLLRVIAALGKATALEVVPTLLPLHALPPEEDGSAGRRVEADEGGRSIGDEARADRASFVARMADELVPAAAAQGLCRMVDAFMEEGAFAAAEVRRLFEAGRRAGLG